MSLATRCTTCATVFRVVQDQLKVSEGWVRCGQCNEVFNALEGLFDLERETGPAPLQALAVESHDVPHAEPGAPSGDAPQAPAHGPATDAAGRAATGEAAPAEDADHAFKVALPNAAPDTDPNADPSADPHRIASPGGPDGAAPLAEASSRPHADRIDPNMVIAARRIDTGSTPAERINERDRLEFPDARFDSDMPFDSRTPDSMSSSLSGYPEGDDLDPSVALPPPGFIRRALRQERWHSSRVRALLGAAAALLLAVLALQWVHQGRDTIAARWPSTQPALVAWCGWIGCTVEAPRRIEDVSVESSSLTHGDEPDAFKLSVALRNHGTVTVALPSVDLALTDPTGQLLARRVLMPRDFRAATTVLAPGAESALQLVLTAGHIGVTGYTVEIFYP
jgi:predicted Zn finger-like uncharacterized protein